MAQRDQIILRVYPPRQVVRVGHTAVFRCRDEGLHRLSVQWAAPGIDLKEVSLASNRVIISSPRMEIRRGRLTIHQVDWMDAGLYACKAGGVTTTAYLNIEPGKKQSM